MANKKLIFIVGGTGAQGLAVIDSLLAPTAEGSPSPYALRILTRDPEHPRAKKLAAREHVELVKGSFEDFGIIRTALQGAYGAFINTDSFTIPEAREVYAGIRIYELAKNTPGLKHYVWSNLEYQLGRNGFNPRYAADHYSAKGRVSEFIAAIEAKYGSPDSFAWSFLTTGPYMDSLREYNGPVHKRKDGTYVFAYPLGDSAMPLVALSDIGFFARYIFDHPTESAGQDFKIISDNVTGTEIAETFTRVTGKPAVYVPVANDAYFDLMASPDVPLAGGPTTFRQNFTAAWNIWREGRIQRDMDWIRSIHPGTTTLEQWMRKENYTGDSKPDDGVFLKAFEAVGPARFNTDKVKAVLGE